MIYFRELESWLTGRKQRICINGSFSDWADVLSGVPQGSVLGPVLFSIFINDIDDGISSKILKFADDTKIVRSAFTQEDINKLREDMRNMFKWSEDWQMLFNLEKCQVMHIGRKNHNAKYEMGGKELIEVMEEKDLGVIVSSDLKVGKYSVLQPKMEIRY